jgi:hypothetical protein
MRSECQAKSQTNEFQSAPGIAAGCCCKMAPSSQPVPSFNPHPASLPGDATVIVTRGTTYEFQSAPGIAAG